MKTNGKKIDLQALRDRLAFTVSETAEVLGGISPKSVYRLIYRGKLRASRGLHHLLIPRIEVERYLEETTKADY